jgi:hypothetical protein
LYPFRLLQHPDKQPAAFHVPDLCEDGRRTIGHRSAGLESGLAYWLWDQLFLLGEHPAVSEENLAALCA